MKRVLIFSLLLFFAIKGMAQKAEAIAGIWWNDEKTSKIEIKEVNGKFIGTVVYINPSSYVNGEPEKDTNNPDPKLRSRSKLGLQILSGLQFNAGKSQWDNGRIYDPENGKTYDCYAWFEKDSNTLYLKGYVVGIKMLGRSTIWTRATN
ncbi:MAG TPA: DUF2147 domain-containing protein [Prolixibacteraceae bacterium]|nr:DUF2147 domain-containing protein [Prolixibacteraceae bacterium]